MPSHPLRVAILECDTGLPKALAKYKRYGAISSALLESGAEAAGLRKGVLDISIWDVVNEAGVFPKLEDVDGVFLTGSNSNWEQLDLLWQVVADDPSVQSEYDSFVDIPWTNQLVDFVKKILAQDRVKLVGVCFGHQIIGRAMGAKVGRNEEQGWEVSVTDVDLTPEGQKVFEGKEVLSIHQMHKDIVFDYPSGVQPLGSTSLCKVQGMFVPRRVMTVQGHPEFTEEILVEILEVRHKQGVFGDEIYDEAMKRVGRRHDGVMVGKRFVDFLLDK